MTPDSGDPTDGGEPVDSGDAPRDGGASPDSGPPQADPRWVRAGTSAPRLRHTASLLPDGRVLIVGGQFDNNGAASALASVEIFDPSDMSYSPAAPLPQPRFFHTATTLADGKILIAGGSDDLRVNLNDAVVYDPADGTWSAPAPLNDTRQQYSATLLADGTVLFVAGFRVSAFTSASAERFDPSTSMFTSVVGVNLQDPRAQHAAVLLDDERLLVLGGTGGQGRPPSLNTAELYDPAQSGSFETVTSTMVVARANPVVTKLSDGRVLITGQSTMAIPDAELFDPSGDGTFMTTGSMRRGRLDHRLSVLASGPLAGQVLVSGGRGVGGAFNACDLYDPEAGNFSITAVLVAPRSLHTATALPDGRVFVFGGLNGSGPVNSGELFEQAP